MGFQALRSPAAPVSWATTLPHKAGFGLRGEGTGVQQGFALSGVCSRDASDRHPAGLWPRVMHPGRLREGVSSRPSAVTPWSQSRLLSSTVILGLLSHFLWPPPAYLEAALLPPLWSRVAAGGPTRLLLSVPHLLIPSSPLSAGQMSPLSGSPGTGCLFGGRTASLGLAVVLSHGLAMDRKSVNLGPSKASLE